MTAAELPDVLTAEQLAAFLGLSDRTFRRRRASRNWPFSPIAGFPTKGASARYSKAHVLAVINGQPHARLSRAS
jgi:hypothetical protein